MIVVAVVLGLLDENQMEMEISQDLYVPTLRS